MFHVSGVSYLSHPLCRRRRLQDVHRAAQERCLDEASSVTQCCVKHPHSYSRCIVRKGMICAPIASCGGPQHHHSGPEKNHVVTCNKKYHCKKGMMTEVCSYQELKAFAWRQYRWIARSPQSLGSLLGAHRETPSRPQQQG